MSAASSVPNWMMLDSFAFRRDDDNESSLDEDPALFTIEGDISPGVEVVADCENAHALNGVLGGSGYQSPV